MEIYREYVGNLHCHTVYSDGTVTHRQLAQAAAEAGLDFVITTDHNVRPEDVEGYYDRTLLLVGEEVHNVTRSPQVSHLLVYGAEQEMAAYSFGSAQTLVNMVNKRGGCCYIAHPVERSSRITREGQAIPWVDWPIDGITGIELWNYMSEFKGLLWSHVAALGYALRPDWGIRGPYRGTLRLWDELLAKGMRISALGGSDAHGITYRMGPFKRRLFPYEYLFRCVNTHLLTRGALVGDVEHDKGLIYEALRHGRTWVGYDLPHSTKGFRFVARSGSAQAVGGEELKRLGATTIEIELPTKATFYLLRNGKRILKRHGKELRHTTAEPGVYRVEAYRRFRLHTVGWIFSSPIYIT